MASEGIDYDRLVREALLGVIRRVLEQIAKDGLPGEQHLYLTFRTAHPEVEIPETLRRSHPEEMTIVLQHQFWDLVVEGDRFVVTLRFDGMPRRLTVPLAALVAVVDPSVPFGLRFSDPSAPAREATATSVGDAAAKAEASVAETRPAGAGGGAGGNVVEISAFRRRRD